MRRRPALERRDRATAANRMKPININIGPIVRAVGIISQRPYREFVERLLSDGRISQAEADALEQQSREAFDPDTILESLKREVGDEVKTVVSS
jgi:hypothetical protein